MEAAGDERRPLAMAVEYRNAEGKMVQVVRNADLKELCAVRALFVTTSELVGDAGEEQYDNDDGLVDNSGTALIDLSLSGCCGVQSTFGGLEITSLGFSMGSGHRGSNFSTKGLRGDSRGR